MKNLSKKFTLLLLSLCFFTGIAFSQQVPARINYQTVVRDLNSNVPLNQQTISMRFTILQGAANGPEIYKEHHLGKTTNQYGLLNLSIGAGAAVLGNFSQIDWSDGQKFIRVEFDPNNGTNWQFLGTSQFLTVPYAMVAQSALSSPPQTLSLAGDQLTLSDGGGSIIIPTGTDYVQGSGITITGNSIAAVDNSASNELQTLSVNGPALSLSNGGGTVTIPITSYTAGSGINIANNAISNTGDLSNTNEIQNLSLTGTALSLSNGGGTVTLPTGTTYTAGSGVTITGNSIAAVDNSVSNEIQALSINGSALSLSNGGGTVTLPTGTTYAAGSGIAITGNTITATDNSTSNELQTLSLNGTALSLSSGGGTVTLPTGTSYAAGSGIAITGNTITATDNSVSNELQTLSINGSALSLSNGGGTVTIPAATYTAGAGISIAGNAVTNTGDLSNTNEIQVLILDGADLTLSAGGGTVTLPTGTTYTAGSGITIAGNTISNSGDPNAADDLTAASVAAGDVSGTFSNLQIGAGAVGSNEIANGSIALADLAFTLPTAQWVQSGNKLYYSIGNVGINQSNPTYPLEVKTSNFGGSVSGGTPAIHGYSDPVSPLMGYGVYGTYNVAKHGAGVIGMGYHGQQPPLASDDMGVYGSSSYGVYGRGEYAGVYGETNNGSNFAGLFKGMLGLYGRIQMYDPANTTRITHTLAKGTDGQGYISIYGSTQNKTNIFFDAVSAMPNNGYIGLMNAAGDNIKGGLYLNTAGQAVMFADVKNFRMQHPTQPDKEIWYACPEGPEAAAYERGTAQMINGEARVVFSEHFQLVINSGTMTVVLTPLSADSKGMAVVEKDADGFKVKELMGGTGNYGFDWEVKCVRKGYEGYRPVRDKNEESVTTHSNIIPSTPGKEARQ